jgi:hypothetical protein
MSLSDRVEYNIERRDVISCTSHVTTTLATKCKNNGKHLTSEGTIDFRYAKSLGCCPEAKTRAELAAWA